MTGLARVRPSRGRSGSESESVRSLKKFDTFDNTLEVTIDCQASWVQAKKFQKLLLLEESTEVRAISLRTFDTYCASLTKRPRG